MLPNYIVGIGGSAGGIIAYKELLDCLPSNTGMAFIIATHILPDATSYLAEILSRHTKMPVLAASNGMTVRANHLYVSSPNTDIIVENYILKLTSPRTKSNAVVDYLLISLAKAMGERAIGIILSGYDGDGTEGCKHIKALGGITFAQDASAEVENMPLSAQAAGCIDFVLPPSKIAASIAKIGRASPVNPKLGRRPPKSADH